MTEKEYRLVVQMFSTYLEKKKYILRDILIKEYEEKRNLIDFDDINRILFYEFADIETNVNLDSKRICVICNGAPDITLQIMFAALKNNMRIKLVALNYHDINNFLFQIYLDILRDLHMANTNFYYSEKWLEQDVMEKGKVFDKIIYIGNYFDYENFVYFAENKNVLFWNHNNIKVLMSREENKEAYKEIVKYSYSNNVEIEVYEDEEEFLEELQEGEFAIIYTAEENKLKYVDELKARIIRFNEFNIQNFKFKVNDLILALDFSQKM